MTLLIEGRQLCYRQQEKVILNKVSLSVSAGEIVTIIGPNGAGKSTLLNILLGLIQPSSGKLVRSSKTRIGYMPQKLQLNPQMPLTVDRFLSLTRYAKQSNAEALSKTGVSDLRGAAMQDLSGGELQRVLLARALMSEPHLLVLDEPVQGVDVTGQSQLYALIGDLRDELQCGVLMVSHDLHLVMAGTDQVICLNQHVCCHGHPEAVTNDPAYRELFGEAAANLTAYTHHHDHAHDVHGDVISGTCDHTH